ncbi:hypothetical protein [Ureibacillus acetophenoni]|uniref:Uncharacterized protein n=1 Tax=Ureibacillus acetophenoni TaxID=614649 RepID=A0A285UDN7_9BACL|nr:hypothetical protein [Ureibacillus acetophenoni]SOC40025.1 hypothetical protein SAMN05877842_1072 [Ureibacillus acetophenoni]
MSYRKCTCGKKFNWDDFMSPKEGSCYETSMVDLMAEMAAIIRPCQSSCANICNELRGAARGECIRECVSRCIR